MNHPDSARGDDSAARPPIQADAAFAQRINNEHRACLEATRTVVEHAVACGELLIAAKAAVGHSRWLRWLDKNFDASEDTAQNYMRLARKKAEIIDEETERARFSSVRKATAAIAASAGGSLRDDEPPVGAHGEDVGPGPMPRETLTRGGEVVVLGDHRLACGDATEVADVRRLIVGRRAQCMWTDCPWGVSYTGKTKAALKMQGDSSGRAPALLADVLVVAEAEALVGGSPYYVVRPDGELATDFGLAFRAVAWKIHQTLYWVKDTLVQGWSDHHYRTESLVYGYSPGGKGRRGRGAEGWYGGNAEDNVFEVSRPRANREHPTKKPVALIEANLRNSTRPGDLVYDPFGGSGSVLVACENLGRRALVMEVDPRYCDVICARFQRKTGIVPVVATTGEPRDYLLEEVA